MNVTQVIDEFGGYERAQTLFGVSRSLLVRWEQEGLPAKRWQQIAALSKHHASRELSVAEIAVVAPSKKPKSDEAA